METNTVQGAINNVQGMFSSTPEWIETAQELLTKFGFRSYSDFCDRALGGEVDSEAASKNDGAREGGRCDCRVHL